MEGKAASSLCPIELASMGEKMRATAVSGFMSLELVLPGQAYRTRNSERCWKRYAADSLSDSLSAQTVLWSWHCKGQQQKEI